MNVCLIQVDGKMPNLALMKLAAWHRKKGDSVTVLDISHLKFDRIYASKIFVGGSGVDLKSELPTEIEVQVPDYELFKANYSVGFTSRGCIRDCGFCIVREKEGGIREAPFDWVNGADRTIIMDNNFLASPKWKEKLQYFIRHNVKVCFCQGLDIRLINDENAVLLSKLLYYDQHFRNRRLYFAFDQPQLEETVRKGIHTLLTHGILARHLLFYVLVGYDTSFEEDMHRFEVLEAYGCLPFIMLYNNTRGPLLRKFARWVNKRYYKVCSFEKFGKKSRGVAV